MPLSHSPITSYPPPALPSVAARRSALPDHHPLVPPAQPNHTPSLGRSSSPRPAPLNPPPPLAPPSLRTRRSHAVLRLQLASPGAALRAARPPLRSRPGPLHLLALGSRRRRPAAQRRPVRRRQDDAARPAAVSARGRSRRARVAGRPGGPRRPGRGRAGGAREVGLPGRRRPVGR